ncbi:AAA family ATPase [Aeromonas veronii bv. sobria]|uniref:AAA family ATPase n=1 Tax=Aeromonas veronii TaxID=654 RepID=UPI000E1E3A76|nr:AAA family ATPase [Aeromonas veronii]RDU84501.1 hypothetical protein CGZ72_12595 [Aeromonas veronii]TYD42124.1 hypothetical protein CJF23_15085 [Aeromonas veronii]
MTDYDIKLMPEQIQKLFQQIPDYKEYLKPFSLLLHGPCGTGKTTTARELAKTINAEVLEIPLKHGRADMLWIKKIENFARSGNLNFLDGIEDKPFKVVILDEMDLIPCQCIPLRAIMNEFAGQLFFIGTTNHKNKINDSVLSRFHCVLMDGEDIRQKTTHNQIKSLME